MFLSVSLCINESIAFMRNFPQKCILSLRSIEVSQVLNNCFYRPHACRNLNFQTLVVISCVSSNPHYMFSILNFSLKHGCRLLLSRFCRSNHEDICDNTWVEIDVLMSMDIGPKHTVQFSHIVVMLPWACIWSSKNLQWIGDSKCVFNWQKLPCYRSAELWYFFAQMALDCFCFDLCPVNNFYSMPESYQAFLCNMISMLVNISSTGWSRLLRCCIYVLCSQ